MTDAERPYVRFAGPQRPAGGDPGSGAWSVAALLVYDLATAARRFAKTGLRPPVLVTPPSIEDGQGPFFDVVLASGSRLRVSVDVLSTP